jgi:hypothetical protein
MSKVLYVEPDDEITDLVEKIRRSGEEQDLVFVLPQRTKVLQSPLNLRLLQQYSRSFVKHTAIVSGDPRVQEMAKSAGFPTYASVQAYERGVEVVRPHSPMEPSYDDEPDGHTPDMSPIGAAAATAATTEAYARPAAPMRAETLARPERPLPPPRRAVPPPLPGQKRGRDRRRAYYYLAGAVFLVGILLLFLVAPSATVTITLTATPVSTSNPIQGTTDANLANSPDHVLTTVASADESNQFQAKPTGQKTLPATAATGNVVLQTDLKNVADFTVPKGTEFDSNTTPQIKFFATQDTVVHFGDPDSNGISTSNPIPVQDGKPEGAGNLPANTITQWPGNPCGPNGQYKGVCAPSDLTATNPQPTGGGADAKQVTTASASDVQQWQKQVDDLKSQLTDKAKQDLLAKAGNGKVAAGDPGGGGQTISNDITPLPKADDQYQPTTISVAVHAKGAFYSVAEVKKVAMDDLNAQVAKGEQLAPNPKVPDPKITQASDDGTVIFSLNATGYSEPVIDVQGLKDRFTGKGQADVKRIAREIIGSPVQDVTIEQHIPFFVLPFFSGHIEVEQKVIQKPTT